MELEAGCRASNVRQVRQYDPRRQNTRRRKTSRSETRYKCQQISATPFEWTYRTALAPGGRATVNEDAEAPPVGDEGRFSSD